MPVVRTAVLLFGFPAGEQLSLRDAPWYVGYFFSSSYGIASYWNKQTNNGLIIDGEVFDWAFVDDPNPDLSSRKNVIEAAIRSMENDRGANFSSFDMVITVIAAPPKINSDGGSTTVNSRHRSHAGVAMRVGDRFDFVAHETGHGIGLAHSYGSPSFKAESWSQYGEYGHPYCIMSAMSYGGIPVHMPAVPRDNATEYTGLGPGLNAATALGKGWINAHSFNVSPGASAEFDIASRHLNTSFPRAIQLIQPGGGTYVVEFRENELWDIGQGEPLLIINQGKGSTGDLAHPGTNSATYSGSIKIPITFGAAQSVFNGPGFGIQVIDKNIIGHTVTVRVSGKRVFTPELEVNESFTEIRNEVVETGETDFGKGEVLCAEGVWPFNKVARWQEGIFECTYNGVRPPINVAWTVDEVALTGNFGTLALYKNVKIAQPKLNSIPAKRIISLNYQIEMLATGSRLRLFNRPADGSYTLDIVANAVSSAGSGSAHSWVEFKGMEYVYPDEFNRLRKRCIDNLINIGKRYVRYKVVLPPDFWKRVPVELHEEIENSLRAMSHFISEENHSAHKLLAAHISNLTGEQDLRLQTISLDEKAHIVPQVGSREPQLHMGNERQSSE